MDQKALFELIEAFKKAEIEELLWQQGDEKIRLRRTGGAVHTAAATPSSSSSAFSPSVFTAQTPAASPAGVQGFDAAAAFAHTDSAGNKKTIDAPLVGVLYLSPAPDAPPFVTAGDQVRKGQTVCILEAMKMMSEVPAPFDCRITEVLHKDGAAVGFGTPLFRCEVL